MRRRLLDDGWSFRPKVNLFAELQGTPAHEWIPVTLPHDAMIGTERRPEAGPANAYFPGGVWEYRRTLVGPDSGEDRSVVLDFEGVQRDAVVLVNGEVVARRPYGYSRFFVAVDHLLVPGDNEVRVEATAGDDSRWYSGAGIHRDVWLLESGRVRLSPDGMFVRTPEIDETLAVVSVGVTVDNQTPSVIDPVLRIEVHDADGALAGVAEAPITVFPHQSAATHRRVEVPDPRRWSLDDPHLYSCRALLVVDGDVIDTDGTSFGIRSLSIDARRGLRVNAEPVLLRGACIHHDNGPLGAAAISRADERRAERLKAAGFNAIRSAHNPLSRSMLDACDRIGLLVMDETFDMWSQPKTEDDYSRRFADWWEADVETMVRNARNHPSVVLYCIGNEIPDGSTPTGLEIGRSLAEKLRALDDTRYLTQAVTGILIGGPELFADLGVNTAAMTMAEAMDQLVLSPVIDAKTLEAFAALEVAGYNYMESRYELDAEMHPDRVIVGTETHPFGIATAWSKVADIPNVIGDFVWTGWDYLGEVGIGRADHSGDDAEDGHTGFHAPFPWRSAWCGDIDITGHRRPQSFFREIVFGLRTDPYIAVLRPEHQGRDNAHPSPWSWNDVVSSWSWPGSEGESMVVEVYAAAAEVELLLDGESLGRQPTGPEHGFRGVFECEYRPGILEAVAWTDDQDVGRTALRAATSALALRIRADRTEMVADHHDLCFVDLELVDDAGTIHATADRRVELAVHGPGLLQAVGSADPSSNEPFGGDGCTTFDGRALAIVRPTGVGVVTVTATADGCAPTTIDVEVAAPA